LPYLISLVGPGSGGTPVVWTVRGFMIPEFFMRAFGLGKTWQLAIGDLLLLPINYFLELGLFFVIGWWRWRKWRTSREPLGRRDLTSITMAAVSILVCTFLRSNLIGNNDLGWRGFLIAQFVLLLWAADLLADWPGIRSRALLTSLIALGAAGTLYDVAILRLYPVLADRGAVPMVAWMSPDRQLGKRTYAARQTYEWVDRQTPQTAVIQYNPKVAIQDTPAGLYSDRRAIAAGPDCLCTFGGDLRQCTPILATLEKLYAKEPGPESFQEVCRAMPIDMLVAKDTDPVWENRAGWVWEQQPVFANEYFRVFRCR
jgi:hypothetical protein